MSYSCASDTDRRLLHSLYPCLHFACPPTERMPLLSMLCKCLPKSQACLPKPQANASQICTLLPEA